MKGSSEDSRTVVLSASESLGSGHGFAKDTDTDTDADRAPLIIDRYVVSRVLGQGGMGVVYAAFDPELQREVALKLLVSDRGGTAPDRLLREAQAMARLSHPNVVPVYFVSRDARRPYLVMELVDGTTLSGWLRARPRTVDELLGVFAQAGRGLAAAHAAGLVHRDFKPGNVLVARDGRVLVTDFGLARVADPVAHSGNRSSSEIAAASTLIDAVSPLATLTASNEVLGTPRYMAPEQHMGEAADAACDQYALCVALYEALMGAPPFIGSDLRALAWAKAGGLPRPLPRRVGVPKALVRVLARGLAPRADDRFASIDALLHALARARSARAYRRWIAAVSLVPLVIVGSFSAKSEPETRCELPPEVMQGVWDPSIADAVTDAFAATGVPYAADADARVRARLHDYARAWAATYEQACRRREARGDGQPASHDREPAMACLDERRLELRTNVDLLLEADALQVQGAVTMVHAMTPPSVCLRATVTREAPAYRDALVRMIELHALLRAGRYGPAITAAAAIYEHTHAEGPPELLAQAAYMLGHARYLVGDSESARVRLEEAALLAHAQEQHEVEADAASLLAALLADEQERLEEAEQWSRRAQAAIERGALDEAMRGRWLTRHALLQSRRGEVDAALASYAEAEQLLSQAYGATSPMVVVTAMSHALALSDRGRMLEAKARLVALVPVAEQVFGPLHPQLALLLLDLGSLHEITGDAAAARPLYERALAIWEAAEGGERDLPNIGLALGNLGTLALAEERWDEAEALFLRARAAFERAYGPEHVLVAGCHARLGLLAERRHEPERALEEYRTVLRMYEAAYGPTHHEVAWAHNSLGHALLALSRHGEARAAFERALEILAQGQTDGHPTEGWTRHGLAKTLIAQGQPALARGQLERAIEILVSALGEDATDVAEAREDLRTLDSGHAPG